MKKNSLLEKSDSIIRILDIKESKVLIIDCTKPVSYTHLMEEECSALLNSFFSRLRSDKTY